MISLLVGGGRQGFAREKRVQDMERRLPDLSARLGEVLQDLKKAKRRREEQHQRRSRNVEHRERHGRGEDQAPRAGLGPGPGYGSGEEVQGLSRRSAASSPRGEGGAASESSRSPIPGHHVLVSYRRTSESEGTGVAPDEERRSAPGQLPGEAEDSRSGETSGAGTFSPGRPPRSLQISPTNVGSFAPVARCLSGADMMACLQLLSSAAESGNMAQVRRLEREIRFASSPIGNAVQRMGLLFLRGLRLRASLGTQDMSLGQLNAKLSTSSPRISPSAMASLTSYSKRVPLANIVLASACAALLDAFSNHDRIHFLCLGYNQMVGSHHWVSLIQGLGTRPQGPPKALRFTFVACTYFMEAIEIESLQRWIQGVGRQLETEAGRWGILFSEVECVEIGDAGLQGLAAVCGRKAPRAARMRTDAGTAPAVKEEAESAFSSPAGAWKGAERGSSPRPGAYGTPSPSAVKEEPWEDETRLFLGPSQPGLVHAPTPAQGAAAEDAFSEGSPPPPGWHEDQEEPMAHPSQGEPLAHPAVARGGEDRGPRSKAEVSGSGEEEGLCVCTMMSLYNLVDDSLLNPNPRQAVMEWAKELAPDLFLVAEMPVDQASASPDTRFKQCVQFYAPLLDLHDAVLKQERAQGQRPGTRGSGDGAEAGAGARAGAGAGGGTGAGGEEDGIFHFEQCFLGRHVNKCIGPLRRKLIHTQSIEAWQVQMASLGYAEALWEAPTQEFVRRCLQGLPTDLHLRFSGGVVTFLWRGQVLYFVGKWALL